MNKKIANITICYKNEDEVIAYARELKKQVFTHTISLIVVLNALGGKGLDYLKKGLDKLNLEYEIINPEENLGYLNGVLYGFQNTKKNQGVEWFIISNTDIKIQDEYFISSFFNLECIKSKDVWMVGPSIFAPKQCQYSNPYMTNRPSRIYYFKKIIGMGFPHIYNFLYEVKKRHSKNHSNKYNEKSGYVYAVHGSYIFVNRRLLTEVSEMEPWELLFNEEQYLAEITLINRKRVYYSFALQVHHMEGTSTGKVSITKKYKMMQKANQRMVKEFY